MDKVKDNILGLRTRARFPIFVEAEKAGLGAAKEDFEVFFKGDGQNEVRMSAIVIGGKKRKRFSFGDY